MAKSIVFGTKIILQVSSINYMAGVAMRVFVLTLLAFKKVKLIFGHPVPKNVKFQLFLTMTMIRFVLFCFLFCFVCLFVFKLIFNL